jgi:hypothetical protein
MHSVKKFLACGFALTALVAGSAAPAAAAPVPPDDGPYEPQGQFKAALEVLPHNPEAARIIVTNAAKKDPVEAMKFLDFVAGDSVSNECRQDIANCTWDEIFEL